MIWRGELWGSVHRSIRFEFFLDRQKHAVVLTAAIICIILFGGINNIRERDWRLPDDYRATKTYPFTECCNRKRGRVNFRVPFSCLMGGRSCKRWGSWSRHKPTRITTCTQPKPIPPASQGRRATERERKKLFFSFFFFIWNSRCKQMKTVFIESGGISYAATTLFGSQKKDGAGRYREQSLQLFGLFFLFIFITVRLKRTPVICQWFPIPLFLCWRHFYLNVSRISSLFLSVFFSFFLSLFVPLGWDEISVRVSNTWILYTVSDRTQPMQQCGSSRCSSNLLYEKDYEEEKKKIGRAI